MLPAEGAGRTAHGRRGSRSTDRDARSDRLWSTTAAGLAIALWLTSRYGYLLSHCFVEIYAVVIAASVFLFSWSSRRSPEARPFLVLGIGHLFVALLDLLHTLAYEGMNVLPSTMDYATKRWVAARALQAGCTMAFVMELRRRRVIAAGVAFPVTGAATVAIHGAESASGSPG